MKIFRFRGGIHPEGNKDPTACHPIARLPLPKRLYIPLQQHIGEPAAPEVKVGDHVLKGQRLARHQGSVSAPVHAPTSGTVIAIGDHMAPHPSGLPVQTITLEPDGEERWVETEPAVDPFSLTRAEVAARVRDAGIVGLGGAAFPAAVKLDAGNRHPIDTLIINGGECEPYLTCDDRLMREGAGYVVEGVRLIANGLGAKRTVIAIEDNKPEALEAMRVAAAAHPGISVLRVPSRYPMGSEKQLVTTVTGREIPAGRLSAEIGVSVHNVGTALAVCRAVRFGKPLVSRVVTVGGGAIRNPRNVVVPIGTPAADLVEFCGGFTVTPTRVLMGGPMMGQVLPGLEAPVVKGTSGIIALTAAEAHAASERACLHCGRCVDVCPVGLVPLELAARVRAGRIDDAAELGMGDCLSCGCCAYVCPAHLPLAHLFNYAKGEIAARREAQRKAEETRKLAEARRLRLAAEAAAKAARRPARPTEKAETES